MRPNEQHPDPIPSRIRIGDHPVHPMLVGFPLVLLILAPVTDIVFLVTGEAFWATASFWLLLLGVIAGCVAAIPGLIDFVTIGRARSHREGWYHLLANVGVLSLAVVNIILRYDHPTTAVMPSGLVLSLVTAGLLLVAGWYGWELTFGHWIGVSSRRDSARKPGEVTGHKPTPTAERTPARARPPERREPPEHRPPAH